jgi:hypothetical protein
MAKATRPFKGLVARRELTVERSRNKVIVEIGKPYLGDRCYTCQIRMSHGRRIVHQEIHGIDAFQSLELALKLIPTYLRHSDELPLGRMYAFKQGDDMGFPEVIT